MDGITTSINAILKNLIKNFNTLLDCPVRFSGEYDAKKVHNFIEYIEHYKRIKCIGDEQALQELQFLLLDQAHTWWLRRKANLSTWSEALTILENQYSKRRPAHVVYMEILKHHYGDYESKDDFIDDKIELFNELSQPELREENKLQIIYALLPNEIQNKVKIVDVSNIKDLKEQLKLIKLDSVQVAASADNVRTDTNSTATENVTFAETQENNANKDAVNQEPSNQSTVTSTESNEDPERDPIIKVRRTEDLMPADIKEEDAPTQQEEFITTNAESQNNATHINHEDFHIDSDIMNQINNIIDESEMNMNAINNNLESSSVVKPATNGIASLELLGFNIRTINQVQPEITPKTSSDNQSNKTSLNVTKKLKIRCSYCRKCNHTAQVCFKRAKHMKEFPEKFLGLQTNENNDIINSKNSEEPMETLPSNNTNSNISSPNVSTAETITKVPTISSTTSIPQTSLTATSSVVTTSPSVILNNIPEKCINSSLLTTKLIAPINGKTTNKILTSKLRSINTPSPKCHQCGTVGFYKSICPNCSPIYNNNNNHNPFGK